MVFDQSKEMRIMERRKMLFITVLLGLGVVSAGLTSDVRAEVVVIVNKQNALTAIKRSKVSRFFFKKTTVWEDGTEVKPVDHQSGDVARQEFAKDILVQEAGKIEQYWISESLVGGKDAPLVLADGAAVKRFVSENSGAIGYIQKDEIDGSVKVLEVLD
jgi:hypothetical protein